MSNIQRTFRTRSTNPIPTFDTSVAIYKNYEHMIGSLALTDLYYPKIQTKILKVKLKIGIR